MKLPESLSLPFIAWRHRELVTSFVWRDLKARYEGSLLGRLWPLLNPLILFGVYYLVFVEVLQQRFEGGAGDAAVLSDRSHAAFYIMAGLLPWISFSESIVRCTGVVLENGNLVKKIAFPSQLLPLYAVAVNAIYFVIALAVYVAVRLIVIGGLPQHFWLVGLALILQIVFTTGLGLFLGAMNIFIRDTSQIVQLFLMLWFFTTPIVYPAQLITQAENLQQWSWLMKVNPFFHLVEIYRAALTFDTAPVPWTAVMVMALWAILVFIPGHAFFLATKGRFADEL
ncbi:MAG: ABC transporter permease [Planctomycetes bacterium]|nr:ABC transporter permease [Planctomycetota bacterium]